MSADALIGALRDAGYEPIYWSSEGTDLARALAEPGELIVVTGGDGTVAAVAKCMAEMNRGRVPLAVIPAGTANNIATSLGLDPTDSPVAHIARWRGKAAAAAAAARPFDVGEVSGPWGKRLFVESVGCGLFADMMVQFEAKQKKHDDHHPPAPPPHVEEDEHKAEHAAQDDAEDHQDAEDELRGARVEMRRVLAEAKPRHCRVELDGVDHSGEYLLVEVMNIGRVGPGVVLAPDADPGDGQFDVVFVHDTPEDRRHVDAHLARRPSDAPAPRLTVKRARRVVLDPGAMCVHVDDTAPPADADKPTRLEVTLRAGTLRILA